MTLHPQYPQVITHQLGRLILLEAGYDILHIFAGAQEDRCALVDVVWDHVQDGGVSRGGQTPSLLHDVCHGITLVQQPQLQTPTNQPGHAEYTRLLCVI